MFKSIRETLNNGSIYKYSILNNGQPLSYAETFSFWQQSEDFRDFFISILAQSPFDAYRWETPPITKITANQQFEFVLIDSPRLARTPDTIAFAEHFTNNDDNDGIVIFKNLGKDAILVVPCPQTPPSAYSHLASFIRNAPDAQKHALWRNVGQIVQQKITNRPLWLNTAGDGVSWLHVRLDSRPKYYLFEPYKN